MAVNYLTADLKNEIDDHDKRIGTLEQGAVKRDERIERNREILNGVCVKADRIELAVVRIETSNDSTNKFAKWAIGVVTTVLLAIVTAIITGQAQIIFP